MAPVFAIGPWTGEQWLMGLLLVGLAGFAIALVVAIWTRWGHYRPLRKCLLLSLLGHLLLAGYATTVQIVNLSPAVREPTFHVTFLDNPVGPGSGPESDASDLNDENSGIKPQKSAPTASEALSEPTKPQAPTRPSPTNAKQQAAAMPHLSEKSVAWAVIKAAGKYLKNADDGEPFDPDDESDTSGSESPPPTGAAETTRQETSAAVSPASAPSAAAPRTDNEADQRPLPEVYKLRMESDHLGAALAGGGSPETEAAVQAALRWLTENQSPDGRWDARRHGAGRETMTNGQSRPHAGLNADTGMTALSLLALLAAGETHLHGTHQDNVRRGLEFLLRSQDAEGSLAGSSDLFAAMYCHAMAAFALSEAYGMTGDRRLEQPVRRAIAYTVAAQDPYGGGWRYRPHDPGDTSQLGWQFMALRSAELAGIPIPDQTRQGIIRYLQSVAMGTRGGIAAYQPRKPPSRTMTAEALVCWQFLGLAREHPACNEAGDYLLGALPSEGPNFYYWYYATLATHQLQGEYWRRWNESVRTQLLATQQKTGEWAGSWGPDPLWGGYGGRVYSTALGALCLEVYYRYLPLYVHNARSL